MQYFLGTNNYKRFFKKLWQTLTQIKAILKYSWKKVLATWKVGQELAEGPMGGPLELSAAEAYNGGANS